MSGGGFVNHGFRVLMSHERIIAYGKKQELGQIWIELNFIYTALLTQTVT